MEGLDPKFFRAQSDYAAVYGGNKPDSYREWYGLYLNISRQLTRNSVTVSQGVGAFFRETNDDVRLAFSPSPEVDKQIKGETQAMEAERLHRLAVNQNRTMREELKIGNHRRS